MNSIYGTPVTGMVGANFELDVAANNIANLNTSGYEAVEPQLESLPAQAEVGDQNNFIPVSARTHIGMGVRPADTERSAQQASLEATGNPLDLAMDGPGFIAVRQTNGQIAYARQVSLHVQPDGNLVTADGLSLAPPVRVPAGALTVSVGRDGRLSAQTATGTAKPLSRLTVVSFAAPENLNEQSGLYTETLSSGRPQTVGAKLGADQPFQVMSGYQLRSTVDLAAEMSNMIEAQRMYEANTKALQTLDALVNSTVSLQTH